MAITYGAPSNIITVTGYTEGTPCTFLDIYNVDKAGTLSLHARTGIAGTDGAAVAVDRAERPADYVVLGGASNDLYITVANWNGTTATIRITGTDRDGAAQTEDIVVNANGQYNTTKWFKTITHTQVTVFTATSFDYDLTQGQWGVVSKQGSYQFKISAKLEIGNSGGTTTYFADTRKQIVFDCDLGAHNQTILNQNFANSHLTFGSVGDEANKSTYDGVSILIANNLDRYLYIKFKQAYLYSCNFQKVVGTQNMQMEFFDDDSRLWNCLMGYRTSVYGYTDINVYNILLYFSDYACLGIGSPNIDAATIIHGTYGIRISDFYADATYKNVKIRDTVNQDIYFQSRVNPVYFINCDIENWTFRFGNANYSAAKGWRQYTLNLKVTDVDENIINGAIVKIWDKDGSLVTDATTGADGKIIEQTLNWGYYTEYPDSVSRNVQETPHTLEIRKAGYKTYKKKFAMDSKIDWTIALKTIAINIDSEVIT